MWSMRPSVSLCIVLLVMTSFASTLKTLSPSMLSITTTLPWTIKDIDSSFGRRSGCGCSRFRETYPPGRRTCSGILVVLFRISELAYFNRTTKIRQNRTTKSCFKCIFLKPLGMYSPVNLCSFLLRALLPLLSYFCI